MVARSFSASASAFQSTPSTRRVTMMSVVLFSLSRFQSTPSTRRVTHGVSNHSALCMISIHTLHTEGDL